jgi:dTDP-4-dehydrorhamnose 3,5-epimerase
MEVEGTSLEGLKIIKPEVHEDSRGFFLESYNKKDLMNALGKDLLFVQDNHTKSAKGVLRGLHFQIKNPQGKLIRALRGEIFDVVVDLRKDSKTFGNWHSLILSENNKTQLWVPPGFAHGFLVISDSAEVAYKTTDYWYPKYEKTLIWNDPQISIKWPNDHPSLSKKDSEGAELEELLTLLDKLKKY